MPRLLWKGAVVREKVRGSAELGIDATMAACVRDAAADHPGYPPASEPYERFHSRTGHEVGEIRIFEEAGHVTMTVVGGKWGAGGAYSIFLEIGTSVEGPTAQARAAAAAGNMDAVAPPIGPYMAPRPFLRPAGDREYPKLAARIGAAYRGQEMP